MPGPPTMVAVGRWKRFAPRGGSRGRARPHSFRLLRHQVVQHDPATDGNLVDIDLVTVQIIRDEGTADQKASVHRMRADDFDRLVRGFADRFDLEAEGDNPTP